MPCKYNIYKATIHVTIKQSKMTARFHNRRELSCLLWRIAHEEHFAGRYIGTVPVTGQRVVQVNEEDKILENLMRSIFHVLIFAICVMISTNIFFELLRIPPFNVMLDFCGMARWNSFTPLVL